MGNIYAIIHLMKAEFRDGNIVSGKEPFYELNCVDSSNPDNRIRIYLDSNLSYRANSFRSSGNFVAENIVLRTEEVSQDGQKKTKYIISPSAEATADQKLLIAAKFGSRNLMFKPQDLHLDLKRSTGTVLKSTDNGEYRAAFYEEYFLAQLEPDQFTASIWFSDYDDTVGNFRPHRRVFLNADGNLKYIKKMNEEDWEKILNGDFSKFVGSPISQSSLPLWRRMLGI